ncbi:MAG: phosphoribosyltransferase family protein [Bacteroidales bacterium]|nr:phosphoribosyltransferase family protein [Bacteroidales bacterium]
MGQFNIQLHDKEFTLYKKYSDIQNNIIRVADSLNFVLGTQKEVVCLSVLNGAFMFTADVCKHLHCTPYVSFIKLASYKGLETTGVVDSLIGLDVSIEGKTLVIIEDIVDTGNTIEYLYNLCIELHAKEIFVVSLLFKPNAYKKEVPIFSCAYEIPNDFVVGYGMDYDGLGRNLKNIYVLK